MVCCLVLGGGTRAGFLSDVALQLCSIPLLLASAWQIVERGVERRTWPVLAFVAALVAVHVIQLVPLPPAVWTGLPNRSATTTGLGLLGPLPWLPMSTTPEATLLSLIALLPPAAILLATIGQGYRDRRIMALLVLAVGTVGALLGLTQVAQGPASKLRFFEFTNATEAVGFFANRNHFAALVYCLIVLLAAWVAESVNMTERAAKAKKLETAWILPGVACAIAFFILIAAEAMARSRAGLGLTMLALIGAVVLVMAGRQTVGGTSPTKLVIGVVVFAMLTSVQLTLYRILERFEADPLEDGRIRFAHNTVAAAKAYMPFGSGMGSFVPVYAMFERPEDLMADTFANRAHNDVVELWLETGVAGLVLSAVFLVWLALRAVDVWRRKPDDALDVDQALARAAPLMIALLLAHSLVDYPLRTSALLATLAFACGLLIAPPPGQQPPISLSARQAAAKQQHRLRRSKAAAASSPSPSPAAAATGSAPFAAWPADPAAPRARPVPITPLEDMEWPEEWGGSSRKIDTKDSDRSKGDEDPPT